MFETSLHHLAKCIKGNQVSCTALDIMEKACFIQKYAKDGVDIVLIDRNNRILHLLAIVNFEHTERISVTNRVATEDRKKYRNVYVEI